MTRSSWGGRDHRTHDASGLIDIAPLAGEAGVAHLQRLDCLLIAATSAPAVGSGRSTLASMEHHHAAHHGLSEVGRVIENDVGRLAAQLQEHSLQCRRAFLHHATADGGRAGERDQIHARIGDVAFRRPCAGSAEVTTFTTPGGRPTSAASSPMYVPINGVSGAGFRTTVQPASKCSDDPADVRIQRNIPRRDGADNADGVGGSRYSQYRSLLAAEVPRSLFPLHQREAFEQAVHPEQRAVRPARGGRGMESRPRSARYRRASAGSRTEDRDTSSSARNGSAWFARPVGPIEGAPGRRRSLRRRLA